MTDSKPEGSTEKVEGEVVTDFALRGDGQEVKKEYNNCAPLTLADQPGRYKLIRVGWDDE